MRFLGIEARRPALPLMELFVPEILRLMELARPGRPLYWCPCRVE